MQAKQYIKINEQVFEELYQAYWKELYLYCNSYVKNAALASELVQDIFISLWENRQSIVIGTARNYLFRAVKLKIFEHYRKQSVRDRYLRHKSLEAAEYNQSTEQHINYRELREAVHRIVKTLPERSQTVYLMSRERGMSNRSIANALLISEKAVEGNITRALHLIRKKLLHFK